MGFCQLSGENIRVFPQNSLFSMAKIKFKIPMPRQWLSNWPIVCFSAPEAALTVWLETFAVVIDTASAGWEPYDRRETVMSAGLRRLNTFRIFILRAGFRFAGLQMWKTIFRMLLCVAIISPPFEQLIVWSPNHLLDWISKMDNLYQYMKQRHTHLSTNLNLNFSRQLCEA